jgi:hypothetical protein
MQAGSCANIACQILVTITPYVLDAPTRPYGKPTGIVYYYELPRRVSSLACNISFVSALMWISRTTMGSRRCIMLS